MNADELIELLSGDVSIGSVLRAWLAVPGLLVAAALLIVALRRG